MMGGYVGFIKKKNLLGNKVVISMNIHFVKKKRFNQEEI